MRQFLSNLRTVSSVIAVNGLSVTVRWRAARQNSHWRNKNGRYGTKFHVLLTGERKLDVMGYITRRLSVRQHIDRSITERGVHMSSDWYIQLDDQTVGPVTGSKLLKLAQSSRISTETPLRKGEQGKWTRAGKVSGLFSEAKVQTFEETMETVATPINSAPIELIGGLPDIETESLGQVTRLRRRKKSSSLVLLGIVLAVGVCAGFAAGFQVGSSSAAPTQVDVAATGQSSEVPHEASTSPPVADTPKKVKQADPPQVAPMPVGTGETASEAVTVSEVEQPSLKADANSESTTDKILANWCKQHRFESGASKRIGDVDVFLGNRYLSVYVPTNVGERESDSTTPPISFRYYSFCRLDFRNSTGVFAESTGGLVPINGKPERVSYKTSDKSIANIDKDGQIMFVGSGEVEIIAEIGGESIAIPLHLIEVPVKAGDDQKTATTVQQLIESQGFPDRKKPVSLVWPNSDIVDGVFYDPTPTEYVSTEHWEFDEYPGAVFVVSGSLEGSHVWGISTVRKKRSRN